ncbi:MAG TPA: tRNA lysidine(34) synthetase TilS [Anaerohalosphaeraceae bacterium]|nr:tRNA lysidine(34) synthetase TilS [Anaerohalosphaeraceae bacterium]HOL32803.1 tRNA lysidine(34) synthetase TilS [Anaerohalosphaeraceae bacterium]HOM76895.1 tRNA lysidine(34) synthetase TilS [Anaerohalosphaeraceae bacterium]HPC64743.1 tRNA lysidine(34) synthetase TilS [Anaerohalosphaeraceae bacterium]HPO70649.1 tRNA lysidine(34) synthetase TilS [Anaerohalosphaeraceae bacterium]
MLDAFEDNLCDWILAEGLIKPGSRLLLAVSGGADSVAMAAALCRLRDEGRLTCDFIIGHVNHCLRGSEADDDENFVRRFSAALGLPAAVQRVDVRSYAAAQKLSIETAARFLRLESLAAMAKEHRCDAAAAAHHQDDLAETVIYRLMRGTGFRGLCGIRPASEIFGTVFVRPLLNVRRSEIIRYCRRRHLDWREDATNRDTAFARNRIRLRLMPALEDRCIAERLSVLSAKCRRFVQRTEQLAQSVGQQGRWEKGGFVIEQSRLRSCPPWVMYELLRRLPVQLGIGLRDYSREHFEAMRRLAGAQKSRIALPGPAEAFVEKGYFFYVKQIRNLVLEPAVVQIGKTMEWGQWQISSRLFNRQEADCRHFFETKNALTEWFDADKVKGPITIRLRQQGDRFWPIGADCEQKAARFLLKSGLDTLTRQNTVVIADAEKILWLAPVRASEQAKITLQTTKILEMTITPLRSI